MKTFITLLSAGMLLASGAAFADNYEHYPDDGHAHESHHPGETHEEHDAKYHSHDHDHHDGDHNHVGHSHEDHHIKKAD
jgi:zinc transport system substrate-binding protein